MKKVLFLVILFSLFSFSQNGNNRTLTVEYEEYRIFTQGFINLDLGTLHVSDKISYYNSIVHKKLTSDFVPDESAILFKKSSSNNEILPEIIIDKENKLLTERLYEDLYLESYFSVQEPLPIMNWKFLDEKKTIGEYNCKKASVEFRGRIYFAWYTIEIPISLGPWKFNGLPGLILEIEDQKGIYKWQAKKISYNNITKDEIVKKINNDSKFKKITFKDFDSLKIGKIQEKIQTVKSRSGDRGKKFGMSISFEQNKEPINEYRTEMIFE